MVAVAHRLEELVRHSTGVVLATPRERRSQWEELAGGKRIVTYTRLEIEARIDGAGTGEVWVRTLGGAVDGIGQVVAGEAALVLGERSIVFLTPAADGVLHVMGMAQGHYPLVASEPQNEGAPRIERLVVSPSLGTLVARKGGVSAGATLAGKTAREAADLVREARRALDAKKPR